MSAADLMAVLLARHLSYDFDRPDNPGNDHLIFSKGHASPLLYSAYKAVGAITDDELLTFRKLGSRMEGHPTPGCPGSTWPPGRWARACPSASASPSCGSRLDRLPYRTWVLCGDSEMAEGSLWEAFEHAGIEGLDHLTAIIDVNRLGQRGPTRHGWDLDAYARRIRAFGWHTVEIDGHDIAAIDEAMTSAENTRGAPTAIIARTRKGKGATEVEDKEGKHGKPLSDPAAAIRELGGLRDLRVEVQRPPDAEPAARGGGDPHTSLPRYATGGDPVATRTAFGETLAALGSLHDDVVVLDGEVGDSTKAQLFAADHAERYFECYIAEQQMIAAAVGIGVRGWTAYACTFAAFLTRAHDFLRMAAISRSTINVVGTHAGVAIGEDGPSQMALEDLAMMRAVHGTTVLYPCDANQTVQLVTAMADRPGISYLRATRGESPVIYGPGDAFPVGGSKVLRSHPDDQVTLIGSKRHRPPGARRRRPAGRRRRPRPGHRPVLGQAGRHPDAAHGGRGDRAVRDRRGPPPRGRPRRRGHGVLRQRPPRPRHTRLAVHTMPGSATPAQQLDAAGISAPAIAAAARKLAAT